MRKRSSFWLMSEKATFWIFTILIVLYFVLIVLLKISEAGGLSANLGRNILSAIVITWRHYLAPVFITLNIALFILSVVVLIIVWPMRGDAIKIYPKPSRPHGKAEAKKSKDPKFIKHWTQIINKANTGRPENIRSAVLEADALVDMFLKDSGFEGDFLADRLAKIAKGQVKSLERLWTAHRLRNEIAHTPGYEVSAKQGQKSLLAYRDFLKEMGAF